MLLGYKVLSAKSGRKWLERLEECMREGNGSLTILFSAFPGAKVLAVYGGQAAGKKIVGYTAYLEKRREKAWVTLDTFVLPEYRGLGKKVPRERRKKTAGLATKLTYRLIAMARRAENPVEKIVRITLRGPMLRVHQRMQRNPRKSYTEKIPGPMEKVSVHSAGRGRNRQGAAVIHISRRRK